MAAARFEINPAGAQALLRSAAVRRMLLRRAERGASVAKASAPVSDITTPGYVHYRDTIHAETATTDRAVGRIVADSDHAIYVEATYRTLGRALDAAQ